MTTIQSLGKVSTKIFEKCWNKIMADVNINPVTKNNTQDLIPMSQLQHILHSLDEDLKDVSDALNLNVR